MQCQNLFRHCLKQYYLSSLQSFCGNKRVCITVHAFAYFPKMLSDDVSMRGQKEEGKARISPQFLSQSESDPEPKRVWPLAFSCRLVDLAGDLSYKRWLHPSREGRPGEGVRAKKRRWLRAQVPLRLR